jgi:hypothetical protein
MEATLGKSERSWMPPGVGSWRHSTPAGGAVVGRGGRPLPEMLWGSGALPRHESDSGAPPRCESISFPDADGALHSFRAKELLCSGKVAQTEEMAAAATSLRGARRGAAGAGGAGAVTARAGRSGDGRGEMCGGSHISGLGIGGLLDRGVVSGPRFFSGPPERLFSGLGFGPVAGDALILVYTRV